MIIGDKPKKNEDLQVFTEYDNEEKDEHIGKLYRVPRKKRGFRMSIPLSDLKHLSSQKQRWFRWDLEPVEENESENDEVKDEKQEELEEVDKASRTPINLKLMSKGRKQKLKAIALGEMREQLEEDEEKENI